MKKILIIEDEPVLQSTLKETFEKAEYEVIQAFDGDEAVQKVHDVVPDIVLLDLILPKKHGFEILKEIKADEKTKDVPVLVLTNLEESEEVMQALELGARGYLVKANYGLKEVLDKVKEVIG